jgi:leucyl aminopeptidase
MFTTARAGLLLPLLGSLLSTSVADQSSQHVLTAPHHHHVVDTAILAALDRHPDPVDAYLWLHPEASEKLAEPRLLRVAGEAEPRWLTEGDKMRLRRQHKKFVDVTDHQDFYEQHVGTNLAGEARESCNHLSVVNDG